MNLESLIDKVNEELEIHIRLCKELEVYKKALDRAVADMNELGIDVYSQIACGDEEETKLLDSLIEKHGWECGWKQYYLQKARG